MKHHRLDADLPVAVWLLPFRFHLPKPAHINKTLIGRIATIQHALIAQEGKEAVAPDATVQDFGDRRHVDSVVAAGNVVVKLDFRRVFLHLHLQRQPLFVLRRPCPRRFGGVGKIRQGGHGDLCLQLLPAVNQPRRELRRQLRDDDDAVALALLAGKDINLHGLSRRGNFRQWR